MSQWVPCKRRDFIQRLRSLGFDGPSRVCEKSWDRRRLARPRRLWERGRLVRPGVRGDERRTGGDAPALWGWRAHAPGRQGGRDVCAPSGSRRLFTDPGRTFEGGRTWSPAYGIMMAVIVPSGATMTPNGVSTAGHAESHAWGDCVRHQRPRVTMQRSPNQESHGFSRVECQETHMVQ